MPEYHIDKGEYWCKCKAQRPEYFPCYDNEDRDCSYCIYGEKKFIIPNMDNPNFLKVEKPVKVEFEGDVTTQILKPNMIGHYNEPKMIEITKEEIDFFLSDTKCIYCGISLSFNTLTNPEVGFQITEEGCMCEKCYSERFDGK